MAEQTPFAPQALQQLRGAAGCLRFGAAFVREAAELTSGLPGPEGAELASAVARLEELLHLVVAHLRAAGEQLPELEEVAHGG